MFSEINWLNNRKARRRKKEEKKYVPFQHNLREGSFGGTLLCVVCVFWGEYEEYIDQ